MNARSRRNFVNSMMAATAAAMGGSPLIAAPWQDPPASAPAQGRGRQGGTPRPKSPRARLALIRFRRFGQLNSGAIAFSLTWMPQ